MPVLKGEISVNLDDTRISLVTTTGNGDIVIIFRAFGAQMELLLSPADALTLSMNLTQMAAEGTAIYNARHPLTPETIR